MLRGLADQLNRPALVLDRQLLINTSLRQSLLSELRKASIAGMMIVATARRAADREAPHPRCCPIVLVPAVQSARQDRNESPPAALDPSAARRTFQLSSLQFRRAAAEHEADNLEGQETGVLY